MNGLQIIFNQNKILSIFFSTKHSIGIFFLFLFLLKKEKERKTAKKIVRNFVILLSRITELKGNVASLPLEAGPNYYERRNEWVALLPFSALLSLYIAAALMVIKPLHTTPFTPLSVLPFLSSFVKFQVLAHQACLLTPSSLSPCNYFPPTPILSRFMCIFV